MKMIIPVLMCLAFLGQASADEQTIKDLNDLKTIKDANVMDRFVSDVNKKFIEFVPKLRALGQKYPNDIEIQLGLAQLYDLNPDPALVSEGASAKEQYEKILRLDPNNRSALAFFTDGLCMRYVITRRDAIENLDNRINLAKKYNEKVIVLNSSMDAEFLREHWFKEDDKGITITQEKYKDSSGNPITLVKIHNFALARKSLRKNFDERAPDVIKATEKNQSKDPGNAFYNYLKARTYFTMEKDDDALKEIERGVAKKYCGGNFDDEKCRAAARVLSKVNFPQLQRDFIASRRAPFEDFINMQIWHGRLEDLSKNCESQGDFKKAEKIYELTAQMAKQCEDKLYPLGLEKVALKRLDEVRKKMPQGKNK